MRLHHVQVSMPRGGEEEARRFYGAALGLEEVAKPPSLAGRGGCWFRAFDGASVVAEVHLGVDVPFVAAKKAHPALLVESVDRLEALGGRLSEAGYDVTWADRTTLEGFVRFHAKDGFGNRLEVLCAAT